MNNGSFLSFCFGVGVAIGIHQIAWWLRLHCLSLPAMLGTVWAVIATGVFAHEALTASGFADGIPQFIFVIWLVFCGIVSGMGKLHAEAIPCRWWIATAALFFESLIGCLVAFFVFHHAFVTYQMHAGWPRGDYGTLTLVGSFEFSFYGTLIVSLLLLAIFYPIWRRHRLHQAAI